MNISENEAHSAIYCSENEYFARRCRHYKAKESKAEPVSKGKAIVDGMEQVLRTGDVITIAAGCKHTVEAITALDMIEVQLGEEISVTDKIKFPME